MPRVASPRRRRRSHRSVPLLLGLALLSVAAGAGYGRSAPATGTSVVAQTRVHAAAVELPARDASMPAGFVASVDDARGTGIAGRAAIAGLTVIGTGGIVHGDGAASGADRWSGSHPPLHAAMTVASPTRPCAGRVRPGPAAESGSVVPSPLCSRAPPAA